jgi:hypothetical protein
MNAKTSFSFPTKDQLEVCRKFYETVNGAASFDQVRQWQSDTYAAEVLCSRGEKLQKAGAAMLRLEGGMVEEMPADLSLLQTMAWPANPCIPGFIIMACSSRIKGQDVMVTFYTDLIAQNNEARQNDKELFRAALSDVCERHAKSLEEYQSFLAGRGMLGGCAAECGMLYFFEESDAELLSDIINAALQVYRRIIDSGSLQKPAAKDIAAMQDSREKIVAWILAEDYGVKVARQNNIPLEVMKSYGFPPSENS